MAMDMIWIPPDLGANQGRDALKAKKKTKDKDSAALLVAQYGDPRPEEGFIPWDKDRGTKKDEEAAFEELKKTLRGSVESKYPLSSHVIIKKDRDPCPTAKRAPPKSQVYPRQKDNFFKMFESGSMLSYKREVEAGKHGHIAEDVCMSWAVSRQQTLAARKSGLLDVGSDSDVEEGSESPGGAVIRRGTDKRAPARPRSAMAQLRTRASMPRKARTSQGTPAVVKTRQAVEALTKQGAYSPSKSTANSSKRSATPALSEGSRPGTALSNSRPGSSMSRPGSSMLRSSTPDSSASTIKAVLSKARRDQLAMPKQTITPERLVKSVPRETNAAQRLMEGCNFYSGYKHLKLKPPSTMVEASVLEKILWGTPVSDSIRLEYGPVYPTVHVKGIELFSPTQRMLSEDQVYNVVFKGPSWLDGITLRAEMEEQPTGLIEEAADTQKIFQTLHLARKKENAGQLVLAAEGESNEAEDCLPDEGDDEEDGMGRAQLLLRTARDLEADAEEIAEEVSERLSRKGHIAESRAVRALFVEAKCICTHSGLTEEVERKVKLLVAQLHHYKGLGKRPSMSRRSSQNPLETMSRRSSTVAPPEEEPVKMQRVSLQEFPMERVPLDERGRVLFHQCVQVPPDTCKVAVCAAIKSGQVQHILEWDVCVGATTNVMTVIDSAIGIIHSMALKHDVPDVDADGHAP